MNYVSKIFKSYSNFITSSLGKWYQEGKQVLCGTISLMMKHRKSLCANFVMCNCRRKVEERQVFESTSNQFTKTNTMNTCRKKTKVNIYQVVSWLLQICNLYDFKVASAQKNATKSKKSKPRQNSKSSVSCYPTWLQYLSYNIFKNHSAVKLVLKNSEQSKTVIKWS